MSPAMRAVLPMRTRMMRIRVRNVTRRLMPSAQRVIGAIARTVTDRAADRVVAAVVEAAVVGRKRHEARPNRRSRAKRSGVAPRHVERMQTSLTTMTNWMILATSRSSVSAQTLKTTWMMMTMNWLAPVRAVDRCCSAPSLHGTKRSVSLLTRTWRAEVKDDRNSVRGRAITEAGAAVRAESPTVETVCEC